MSLSENCMYYGQSDLNDYTRLCAALVCDAVSVAESTLHGGGAESRSAARRRWQVPRETQVPSAADHLGRRADVVLLQGARQEDAT